MNNATVETKIKKKSKLIKLFFYIIIALLILFILPLKSAPYEGFQMNLLFVVLEKNYFIPKQSSIFTFKTTKTSTGSEIFWAYGEDGSNYYYNVANFVDDKENTIVFPKNKIITCPGFDHHDIWTWCQAERLKN